MTPRSHSAKVDDGGPGAAVEAVPPAVEKARSVAPGMPVNLCLRYFTAVIPAEDGIGAKMQGVRMKKWLMTLAASALPMSVALAEVPISDRVDAVMATLTLEQKVAQMIQGEIKHVTPDDLRRYGLGSVLNGGGSFPAQNKYSSIQDWVDLADDYYLASIDSSEGSAGIPVIWGTDAVHGHNNVIGATIFPHNIALGAVGDPALTAAIAEATAKEVSATGIDWIFAPTLAVAKDPRWGRTYESYGSNPALVREFAGGVVEAMQSNGIVATAKHFIGDGGTHRGVDQGDTRLSKSDLLTIHGQGYVTAIEAGVMTVMASFNSWNGEKIHGDQELLTTVLRDELGFDGFVVSDWNGIGQVAGCKPDDCAQAINAGIDMIMVPKDWLTLLHNMVAQVKAGEISEARINEAVRRILKVKFQSGLMDRGLPSQRAAGYAKTVGSEAHRALAQEAVRRSLVLVKHEGNLLPLDPAGAYRLAGAGADDIGLQSGGWTISWQGTGNVNADFPGGTSILDGFMRHAKAAGGNVALYDPEESPEDLDAVVLVMAEPPYAEGQGDIETLAWQQGRSRDLQLIEHLKAQGLPVVTLFLTGRPLWINAELNASDAVVVGWLPGSEGAAVADVLMAAREEGAGYEFEGKLPMPWPAQDLNPEDHDLTIAQTVFPEGYGLVASQSQQWVTLSEQPVGEIKSLDTWVFDKGVRDPWTLFIGDDFDWSVEVGPTGATSARGELSLSVVDRKVQEDARRIEFSGKGEHLSQVYFQFEEPVNMRQLEMADGALSFDMRLLKKPTQPVTLRMDCGYPCSGELDITSVLDATAQTEWRTLSFPMKCFAQLGVDSTKVNTPFLLATTGELALEISEVVLAETPAGSDVVSCSELLANH